MLRLRAGFLAAVFALSPVFSQSYAPPYYVTTTAAGTNPTGDGRPAKEAVFLFPEEVAVDGQGAVYVSDTGQHRIRRFELNGNVSTVAGTGLAGFSGDGGPATQARINRPRGLVVDGSTLYFADSGNHAVRAVNLLNGVISTFAGTPGMLGSQGDGRPAGVAQFNTPWGLTLDPRGGLLVTDSGNHRIRRINGGVVTNFAGAGIRGNQGDGTSAALAWLAEPRSIVVGGDLAIYFADYGNRLIRRVLPNGAIQTVAGKGPPVGSSSTGEVGSAMEALIDPAGMVVDALGDIIVADPTRHRLRKINLRAGTIEYMAGNGQPGFAGDGSAGEGAQLNAPTGLALDPRNGIFIADRNNHRIRRLIVTADRPVGTMDTAAGGGRALGDGGAATNAVFTYPEGAGAGPDGNVYVADTQAHCVRLIEPSGRLSTFAGQCGVAGFAGDSGAASQARLNSPTAVAVSREGFVFIADTGNDRIRRVAPNGIIVTAAGGIGVVRPRGLALDPDDAYVYFVNEFEGSRISRHTVSRVGSFENYAGGLGRVGFEGDGGAASFAVFNAPSDVAMDRDFTLYVMDRGNGRVRRIDRAGTVSTLLSVPGGQRLALDANGSLLMTVSDAGADRVLRLPRGASATETLAGGESGLAGDGTFSINGRFDGLAGIAVAPNGRVWLADRNNHRFRVLQPVTAQRVELRGGNNQTGVAGTALPTPLTVRLMLSTGAPLPGATVTFAVQSGTASVNPAQAVTDVDGGAFTNVILGARGGPIVITASFGNAEPARFTLTATEAAIPIVTARPRIAAGGVVGVGNSVPAVRALSTNALISIYGENFAVAGTGRRVRAEEFVNGRLPANFLGVCVTIDGTRAPVIDVFPTQLNVQVPVLASTTMANVTVTVNCGTASELTSEAESVPVRLASPELLYLVNNADGVNPVAAVNAVSNALIGPTDIIASAVPARPGDVITVFGTGFGPVTPVVTPGVFPGAIARVAGNVSLRVDGEEAEILYAGVAPGTVIYQVNFRVPASAASGRLPLTLSIGGNASPAGGYLTVAR